jgi:hypothetical protein
MLKPRFACDSDGRACVHAYLHHVVARCVECNLARNVMPCPEAVTGADVTGCICRGTDDDRLGRYWLGRLGRLQRSCFACGVACRCARNASRGV